MSDFQKSVTFEIDANDAKMTFDLNIEESGLSGTASYSANDGTSLSFSSLSGTVQYQGGIYNGPFAIAVTAGLDSAGDEISATLVADADWTSGNGSYTIMYENGTTSPEIPWNTTMSVN